MLVFFFQKYFHCCALLFMLSTTEHEKNRAYPSLYQYYMYASIPQVESEVQRRVQQQLAVLNSQPHVVPSAPRAGAGAGAAVFPTTADLSEKDRMRYGWWCGF